ncbi:YbhB/YbcL family Raf kinase inhibitor-like protein [Nocardia stercoris]|uniref:YbhB/YbcL family Raf kinase inhibitor-like protein n=1 Tax=Nocardia stercoris TaxID=2483361 RepID=A0A3M2L8M4_9NOCA|nr:YbhB/YbcL family Raf kinase inhibitor-like protein [Nocardia stercoris]RMI33040.1 YbhB/YbcL family Raf kinase inhibitor-like protein [Nocardia stercoris]
MSVVARTLASVALPAAVLLATACGSNSSPTSPSTPATTPGTAVRSEVPPGTPTFAVASPDLADGQAFPAAGYANVFGCSGANHAPTVTWSGAPATAKSFALTMFDPDAPTGSGFWHWMIWDIPATATSATDPVPAGAVAGTNNAGTTGYVGPCPPTGDPAHHYKISVLALDVPTLGLPAATPPAAATFAMHNHVVGEGHLTATAQR